MEDLSSRLTFFYKFVFPTLWIGGFAFGTLLMFFAPDRIHGNQDVREARWIFLLATIVGATLLYWACMRVKQVSLANHEFVISNYWRKIRVHFRDVERVSSSVLINPELIWLHFRRPTEFGTRIVFMPKQRFFGGYTRHPLAKRLSALLVSPRAMA